MRIFNRIALALLVMLAAGAAFAQDTGSIRGTVTDTTGAVVPGATVTLQNEATKFTRNVVTDAKGDYYFGAIQPGAYTVTVEIPGFKTSARRGIRISQREAAGFDPVIEVGAQSERVEVTAQREMIQTETGAREGLLTSDQIDNLSVVGRSPLELLRILPGSVMPDVSSLESVGNLTGTSNTNQDAQFTVNGIRGSNTVVTLDGSKLQDIGSNNGVIVVPNNDMVSEVKVQASNYAAEFGSAGVQVNAITKGGSSEFHGTVYDYIRHYKFQANDRSNSYTGTARPESKFQYPGANISGPILIPGTGFNKNRDKAFFFFGVEFQLQDVDFGSNLAVTPTAAQRNGDFSELLANNGSNLAQPTRVNIPGGYAGAGGAAPNNNLSPYMDPFGQMLLGLYPDATGSYNNNRYNYVFSKLEPQDRLQLVLRLDYNFTENTKAYLRLAQDGEEMEKARGVWWNSSSYDLPSAITHKNKGRSASLNVTSVLSPTTTNEFLFTFSKLWLDIYHTNPEAVSLTALGYPNFQGPWTPITGEKTDVAPVNLINTWSQPVGDLWDPMGNDLYAYNSSLQFVDTFTKVMNTHAIKAGVSVERVRKDQNFQNNEAGEMIYSNWGNGSTGNVFGDTLTARPSQVLFGTPSLDGNFQLWNIDFFLQDSWKVRKNLTLEYGLRFSKMTNNIERNSRGARFDASRYDPTKDAYRDSTKTYMNGVAYAELGEVDEKLIDARPLYIMPRLNFAWDVKGDGDLIVRGGGGLFYNRPMGNAEYDVIHYSPYAYGITMDSYSTQNFAGGRMDYNTIGTADPFAFVGGISVPQSVSAESVDYPRYFTTSLSVGKRLPWQQFLEVGYVGTFGRHLLNSRNDNIVPEGALTAAYPDPVIRAALDSSVVTRYRKYPTLGGVGYWEYNATSNYHALQATLSRQTSGRFQYFLTYTFSKVLGMINSEYTEIDPFDARHRSYGVASYDRTHVANLSWNWMVPDLTKSDNGFLKALLNGWQMSGISNFSSGIPIRLNLSGDISSDGMQNAWFGSPDVMGETPGSAPTAIYTCHPQTGNSGYGEKLLDIGCISMPAYPETGNWVPQYYMRTPARNTHDLTIFKNFGLGGSRKLQIRAGAFNIFNQAFPTYNIGFNDLDLTLQTECVVRRNGVSNSAGGTVNNVCDPQGGFRFTQQTLDNFGKIISKRGRRIIEFAVKFYF
jgi:outer membrane receptor protein involved in Fe transport